MSPGEHRKSTDHDMSVPEVKEGPVTHLQEILESHEKFRIAFTPPETRVAYYPNTMNLVVWGIYCLTRVGGKEVSKENWTIWDQVFHMISAVYNQST
jgi:hypothetical protein